MTLRIPKSVLIVLGVLLAAGAGVGGTLLLTQNESGDGDDDPPRVPAVVGQTLPRAESVVAAEGFDVRTEPSFVSGPKDCRVTDQSRKGEARLGATVTLTVDCRPEVPFVEGLSAREALRTLTDEAGFASFIYNREPRESLRGCTVESQDYPGKRRPEDDLIGIWVNADCDVGCDPAYPDFCIPPPPPERDCRDVASDTGKRRQNFTVRDPDPHHFDDNFDGVGCEPAPE
jgi:hypothetical protein